MLAPHARTLRARTCCALHAGPQRLTYAPCAAQYGVLEIEAAFNIPPANGGVFFAGTYMYAGSPDPSWNEIDQTFINGPYGAPSGESNAGHRGPSLPC